MPSLRDPALDERFDELAAQIRGARPRAPEALRQRVAETAGPRRPRAEPKRRRRLGPILAFAGVLLIGAVVAFAAGGLRGGSGADEESAAVESAPTELRQAAEGAGRAADSAAPQRAQAPAGIPPSPTRLQLYRAQMTIRVDSTAELLNAATRRAIRIARSLGGFVVSADLRTPEQSEGTSRLVLRVPTTKAQTAFERLAGIGTLVAQRVRLDDLQAGVNRRNGGSTTCRRRSSSSSGVPRRARTSTRRWLCSGPSSGASRRPSRRRRGVAASRRSWSR